MMTQKKIWILAAILAVLMFLASFGLGYTLGQKNARLDGDSKTAAGNVLTKATVLGYQTLSVAAKGAVQPTAAAISLPFFSNTPDEKIKLTDDSESAALPFSIDDMMPGDSVSQTYKIVVKEETAKSVTFAANVTGLSASACDGTLLGMKIEADGHVVYDGVCASTPEIPYPIDGKTSVLFQITVTLAESAGNEYENLRLALDFDFTLGYLPIYTVTYSDGVGNTVFSEEIVRVAEGEKTPAFSGTPTRAGYLFLGWQPAVAETVTGDVTYLANWEKLHTVTYADGSGNESFFENQVFRDLQTGTPTPAFVGDPEREGYLFLGWNPSVAETVTDTVTYTATWRDAATFTVVYTDGAEGEEIFPDQIYSDLLSGDLTPAFEGILFREGFSFRGWTPAVSETVENNVTYTAVWEEHVIVDSAYSVPHRKSSMTIEIENPAEELPSDYHYRFTVEDDGFHQFFWTLTSQNDPSYLEAFNVLIANEQTGEVLYDGKLSDGLSFCMPLSGEKGQRVFCSAVITKAAGATGDDTTPLTVEVAFEMSNRCDCKTCDTLYKLFGFDCICPYCNVTLAGIAVATPAVLALAFLSLVGILPKRFLLQSEKEFGSKRKYRKIQRTPLFVVGFRKLFRRMDKFF